MLLSTAIGWGALATGLSSLFVAMHARRPWPRRHLTIAGALLCLGAAPGACVGGYVNDALKSGGAASGRLP